MSEKSGISLQFIGASEQVTGSKTLLEYRHIKMLIDCGLYQGVKNMRELNWLALGFEKELDVVFLTHAHLDHVGSLPRLVNQGFKGKIYCSHPTFALAEIILRDSAKIQEEDAEYANKEGFSKHSPAKPLYDMHDVENTLKLFRPVEHNRMHYHDDVAFSFVPNGHILGATYLEIMLGEKKFVFSGDIGRPNDIMLYDAVTPLTADYVIMESTYGDRLHAVTPTLDKLAEVTNQAVARNGVLLIPSFTVDRAQDFLYYFWLLKKENRIPDVPIYLDTPMGIDVSKAFIAFPEWHRLGSKLFADIFSSVNKAESYEDTSRIVKQSGTKIVISGSGMMNGGRILYYLKKYLEVPSATVLISGYQAFGTRGRQLKEGAHELKIHGQYYKVKCHVDEIKTMSSHADQSELLGWLSQLKYAPKKVFIIHGEKQASDTLRLKIKDTYHYSCVVPKMNQRFENL